jgi:hypothetical protein
VGKVKIVVRMEGDLSDRWSCMLILDAKVI